MPPWFQSQAEASGAGDSLRHSILLGVFLNQRMRSPTWRQQRLKVTQDQEEGKKTGPGEGGQGRVGRRAQARGGRATWPGCWTLLPARLQMEGLSSHSSPRDMGAQSCQQAGEGAQPLPPQLLPGLGFLQNGNRKGGHCNEGSENVWKPRGILRDS